MPATSGKDTVVQRGHAINGGHGTPSDFTEDLGAHRSRGTSHDEPVQWPMGVHDGIAFTSTLWCPQSRSNIWKCSPSLTTLEDHRSRVAAVLFFRERLSEMGTMAACDGTYCARKDTLSRVLSAPTDCCVPMELLDAIVTERGVPELARDAAPESGRGRAKEGKPFPIDKLIRREQRAAACTVI